MLSLYILLYIYENISLSFAPIIDQKSCSMSNCTLTKVKHISHSLFQTGELQNELLVSSDCLAIVYLEYLQPSHGTVYKQI